MKKKPKPRAREILYVVRNVDTSEATKPSVSIKRTAATREAPRGSWTWDVTATGRTLAAARLSAQAESEALLRWAAGLEEVEKFAREQVTNQLLEQSVRESKP